MVNSTRYEGNGVDDKLLKLAADTGGTLLTADYNLAKVAEVKALRVLNLSELVIALRPEVQPGDERLLKPDPAIYRVLLERNGIDAAACVFIDDSEKNVRGAEAVGMKAIHFTTPQALRADLAGMGLL